MGRLSLKEAKERYEGRRWSKQLVLEINGAGYTCLISRSTGTIAEVRSDPFPGKDPVKTMESC